MPFVVVYDANVLYGNTLRDPMIRLARTGMVRARWSEQILDETMRSIAARRPDIAPEKLTRLRALIVAAVPDCLVRNHEPLIEAVKLPDPDDRHVVAAAIMAGAQQIVTANLVDFPDEQLARWHVRAIGPDEFVLDQIAVDDRVVWACVQQIADARRNPPETVDDVLAALERAGLLESVAALRAGRRR
ncbi:PIN domain-containing protein [Nocardia sp. NPDC050697]|uniref:PIN domain-containing protein n=1 Tax=Nocardia sp. NPDC050697 TaxID=3155158 RepID=UPI0033E334E1